MGVYDAHITILVKRLREALSESGLTFTLNLTWPKEDIWSDRMAAGQNYPNGTVSTRGEP